MRLREKKRFRETRIVGIQTGIPTYVPPKLEIRGFKLKFYDTSDVKIGEIGSDVKRGRISDVNFELLGLGCGAFSFILEDIAPFTISYRTRVDVHPYFDASPWFTGFIQTIPQVGQKRPLQYSGYGFFEQLDWVTVNKNYEALDVADIVKDIISTVVAPNTQIIYNEAKIEATGHIVDSVDFYLVYAKDAIQTLADMAQGFEFGVDNSREFYFRPISETVNYSYWVGKHFQDIDIQENPHKVRNRLYIKVGLIQGEGFGWIKEGSNCIGYVEDEQSIIDHGLREDVITAPDILSVDDAWIWGAEILSKLKDPEVKAKIQNIFFDSTKAKIEANGKVRITVYDGTEYSLFIKKVSYTISSSGVLGQLELEQ